MGAVGRGRRSMQQGRSRTVLNLIVVLAIGLVVLLAFNGTVQSWLKAPLNSPTARQLSEALTSSGRSKSLTLAADSRGDATLVLYQYDGGDPVYTDNFHYFLQWGMAADDGCTYIIMVPEALHDSNTLPKLPTNAKYFRAKTEHCFYGFGMFGQLLSSGTFSRDAYKHFIFMNSHVRGPFMPAFLTGTMHWSRLFTRLVNDDIKLVGPTVTCQNIIYGVDPSLVANLTVTPHVQYTAMATDQAGLGLMERSDSIFKCHQAGWEDDYFSQMMASKVLLDAGHNLATFMVRYRGVDWRSRKNWDCNGRLNPVGEFFYDGSTLNTFEVMFVPMNSMIVENNWSFARQAALYQSWGQAQATDSLDVNSNVWISDPWPIKHQRIAYMQSRGPGCFDHRYYLRKNPDLAVLKTVLELWDHFVMLGQFEGRSYRWSCDDDRKLPF